MDGADDGRGARPEELDERALLRGVLDLGHRHGPLGDDELVGQLGDLQLARRVVLGEREHRIARDTREDDAVERRRDELGG